MACIINKSLIQYHKDVSLCLLLRVLRVPIFSFCIQNMIPLELILYMVQIRGTNSFQCVWKCNYLNVPLEDIISL